MAQQISGFVIARPMYALINRIQKKGVFGRMFRLDPLYTNLLESLSAEFALCHDRIELYFQLVSDNWKLQI